MVTIKSIIIDKNLKEKISNLDKMNLPIEIDNMKEIDNFIKNEITSSPDSKDEKEK